MSDIKLFDEWDSEEAEIHDDGLVRYINIENIMVPRSEGRHTDKQFYKSDVQIVERLLNHMYVAGHKGKKHKIRSGINTGKSQKLWKIIKSSFKIIEEETDENPVQVLVTALENSSPKEEVVTYQRGGILARKAVITSPQRRIDLAVRNLVHGAYSNRLASDKDADESLADEILTAYDNGECLAVRERKRREKEAQGAR